MMRSSVTELALRDTTLSERGRNAPGVTIDEAATQLLRCMWCEVQRFVAAFWQRFWARQGWRMTRPARAVFDDLARDRGEIVDLEDAHDLRRPAGRTLDARRVNRCFSAQTGFPKFARVNRVDQTGAVG